MTGLPFCDEPTTPRRYAKGYFTELTVQKALLYGAAITLVLAICLAVISEVFIDIPCHIESDDGIDYKNPSYVHDPCRHIRYPQLFWLTKEECTFGRSQVAAVILGGIIGWERRQADRPAGVRTMALVSLGACLFTINSSVAFIGSPMSWDSSRVSAAIHVPSGVGFLGAGLIFKEAEKDEDGSSRHVVHGLTTAASVWLSAAVGVACGGELYFSATFCTSLVLVLLRFGPRMQEFPDSSVEIPPSVYFQSAKYSAMSAHMTASEDSANEEKAAQQDEGRSLISGKKNVYLTERPRQKPHFSSLV